MKFVKYYILLLIILLFFRKDVFLIAIYFFTLINLIHRKNLLYHFLFSSGIALIWMVIAKNYYRYNTQMLSVFGINLFSLFGWAFGLFVIYFIYYKIVKGNAVKKWVFFIAIYWTLLIFAETFAYHVLNVHDIATAGYKGLPLCNCIHAPPWMQISYFMLGLIYFGLCNLMGLEKKVNDSRDEKSRYYKLKKQRR